MNSVVWVPGLRRDDAGIVLLSERSHKTRDSTLSPHNWRRFSSPPIAADRSTSAHAGEAFAGTLTSTQCRRGRRSLVAGGGGAGGRCDSYPSLSSSSIRSYSLLCPSSLFGRFPLSSPLSLLPSLFVSCLCLPPPSSVNLRFDPFYHAKCCRIRKSARLLHKNISASAQPICLGLGSPVAVQGRVSSCDFHR